MDNLPGAAEDGTEATAPDPAARAGRPTGKARPGGPTHRAARRQACVAAGAVRRTLCNPVVAGACTVGILGGIPRWRRATCAPRRKCRDPADVDAVPANVARGSRGRRGPEPPAPRPGGLHPPGRTGHLLLAAARLEGLPQRRADRPRGDGRRGVPGGALSGSPAARALRAHRPLDRVRRRHLPPAGPQGQRLPPRPHPRGDVHPRRQGPLLVVQRPAAVDLPDPVEVPRRAAAAGRSPARPGVLDEGLLLLRPRRRGAGGVLQQAPRGVHEDLRPAGPRLRHRHGDGRRHGRVVSARSS